MMRFDSSIYPHICFSSDEPTGTGGTAANAAPAPATGAQHAPPAAPPSSTEPEWLPGRLERERRTMLRDLGFDNEEQAKAAAVAKRAADEATKTEQQKRIETEQKLTATNERATALEAAVTEMAARMMVGLNADQQKAVKDVAGNDPALQVKAIHAFAKTWAEPPKVDATPAVPSVPKGAASAPAANTAPSPTSAPGAAPTSPPDHRAVYQTMRQSNPFAAAVYGLDNSGDVYKPQS